MFSMLLRKGYLVFTVSKADRNDIETHQYGEFEESTTKSDTETDLILNISSPNTSGTSQTEDKMKEDESSDTDRARVKRAPTVPWRSSRIAKRKENTDDYDLNDQIFRNWKFFCRNIVSVS